MSSSARHPGKVLQEEYLEPLGISSSDLAKAIKVEENNILDLLTAQRGCTGDIALRLAKAFNTRPQFWMGLQSHWDLQTAAHSIHIGDIGVLV